MAKRARSKGGSQPLAKRGARRIATPGPAGTPSQGNGVPVRVSADSVDPGAGFLVVGVGASAGGLEAFSTLLRGIPQDTPIALVFVQHLAADHRSLLPELLGAVSAFPVEQARDGVAIRPGHVYVIPPDARMTVNDGHLALAARAGGYASAIDHFLVSLADQYRERSVGVVLTGGGHDGATGIREIKAAGGITMVQSPAEAAMDSMPRAAIATGAVDLVMPLGRIAEQLAELSRHPFLKHPAAEAAGALDAQDERLRRLFQLLRRSSGVDFSQYKPATLVRRIQRRMALHRLSSAEAYLAFIETNPSEAEALYEDILIHVTSFFREPESFEILKERILPALLKDRSADQPLRIWVPGCSSGEEVYSVAMILHEVMGDAAMTTPIQIFGTDVSQKMVDRARAGIYPDSVAGDLGPERLRRFFTRIDGGYRINKMIREGCVFARQDITRDPPFSRLHLVVCRNLLIYLGQPLQRKVIEVFHYALRPGGFLVLGRSETIGSHAELFALADKRFKVYRTKPGTATAELDFSPPLPAPLAPRRQYPTVEPRPDADVQGEANRVILDRYGPPGVIVDSNLRIVRTRGRTSPYLELPPGDASLNVLKMARQGLLFGLRNAIDEARKRAGRVRKEGLRVTVNDEVRRLDLDVTPVGNAGSRHYLVLFEEGDRRASGKPAKKGQVRKAPREAAAASDTNLRHLEQELEASRQYLQSIIQDLEAANEELQSANEEILSSNEELQSTNEELDTAKEELQSTNEELSTLNEELQGRNEELSRANSDLVNLLASVQIPIVIVTSDLKIRRFTPAAERMLNLIAADVGRPIGHIKPNIHCPDLEALIQEVIDTVTNREREVQDQEGNLYTLRIRPYKNVDNRIDGAVLTLFDISAARNHAVDLQVARDCAEAIISTVKEPILLLTGTLAVQSCNRAFETIFGLAAEEIRGRPLFELGGGQWSAPELRRVLAEVLPEKKNFEAFALELQLLDGGKHKVLLDGRRFETGRPAADVIVLVIRGLSDGRA